MMTSINRRVERLRTRGRVALWHFDRIPEYTRRVAVRSAQGSARFVRVWWWWQSDAEGADQMIVAKQVAGSSGTGLNHMTQARTDHRRSTIIRGVASLVLLAGIGWGVESLRADAGNDVITLVALAWVALTAAIGPGHPSPVFDSAKAEPRVAGLTSAGIERALRASGHSVLNRLYREAQKLSEGDPKLWRSPITPFDVVDNGDGVRSAEVRLPDGVTVRELNKTADKISGALDKPEGLVWLEQGGAPSDLRLTILPKPLHEMTPRPWPHLTQPVDPFVGVTVGWGPTGRPIVIDPLFASHKLGGEPGSGKSNALRVLGAAYAEWPSRLLVFNMKGNLDFGPLLHVAHAWRTGDDDDDLDAVRYWVEWTVDWIKTANKRMRALPYSVVPEQKLTPELLQDPEWSPPRLFLDEVNLALDPGRGKERAAAIRSGLKFIVEKGRSLGAGVTIATQRWESGNVPPDIAASIQTSIAFQTASSIESIMILGDSWTGPRPHTFGDAGTRALGLSAIRGAQGGQLCQWVRLDLPEAEALVESVARERLTSGHLSGQAVGDDETPEVSYDTFETRVAEAVAGVSGSFVSTGQVRDTLADRWPDLYGDWSKTKVSHRLKAAGGVQTTEGTIRGYTVESLSALGREAVSV